MKNIVFPNYEHSILNLINSILKYYKVETKYNGLPKLKEELDKKYKNVVLIILDGMGERVLKKISPNGYFSKHIVDTITSTCPSTTTAALTTYYSGKPPIETGWISMSQYFKEYGRTLEMLRKIDAYTGEKINNAKINVYDLVKYEPIYEQIEKASPNVKAYEIKPVYCDSRSKRSINADNIEYACEAIKAICSNKDENFILLYSDNPDALLHKYGCESEEVKEFLLDAEKQIENFVKDLSDTLVIVAADHGHKDIEKVYNIIELPELQDCVYMPPSLESRAVSFWVKDDKKEKFENFFKEQLKDEFILYTKEEFLKNNFLGYGQKHPKIDDFIGNYIAISIGGAILKLGTNISRDKAPKKSTHCGFTPDEMEVPLIIL